MNTPFYSYYTFQGNPGAFFAPVVSQALTITLGGLANGSARQSTFIASAYAGQNQNLPDGSGFTSVSMAGGYHLARIYFKITVGSNPLAGGNINFYLLQSDAGSPAIITDGAGVSDAAFTTLSNAALIYSVTVTAVSSILYTGSFVIPNPGPSWGIAVQNNTGVALTSGSVNYIYETSASKF
jgi:hypothetical protein